MPETLSPARDTRNTANPEDTTTLPDTGSSASDTPLVYAEEVDDETSLEGEAPTELPDITHAKNAIDSYIERNSFKGVDAARDKAKKDVTAIITELKEQNPDKPLQNIAATAERYFNDVRLGEDVLDIDDYKEQMAPLIAHAENISDALKHASPKTIALIQKADAAIDTKYARLLYKDREETTLDQYAGAGKLSNKAYNAHAQRTTALMDDVTEHNAALRTPFYDEAKRMVNEHILALSTQENVDALSEDTVTHVANTMAIVAGQVAKNASASGTNAPSLSAVIDEEKLALALQGEGVSFVKMNMLHGITEEVAVKTAQETTKEYVAALKDQIERVKAVGKRAVQGIQDRYKRADAGTPNFTDTSIKTGMTALLDRYADRTNTQNVTPDGRFRSGNASNVITADVVSRYMDSERGTPDVGIETHQHRLNAAQENLATVQANAHEEWERASAAYHTPGVTLTTREEEEHALLSRENGVHKNTPPAPDNTRTTDAPSWAVRVDDSKNSGRNR